MDVLKLKYSHWLAPFILILVVVHANAMIDYSGGRSSESGHHSKKSKGSGSLNEFWEGKWFPTKPAQSPSSQNIATDSHGRPQMGVANKDCDDGQTRLEVDWDLSPVNYTCYHPKIRFPPRGSENLEPVWECKDLPDTYTPSHFCMRDSISYADDIPTHGDHRPLWPMFGEYKFVPPQRWLHNIEHGAVVMLYHPCADPEEVNALRELVVDCFGKHIITPYTRLSKNRPLALVAWGCRLVMSTVDEVLVKDFIRAKALRGPEGTYAKEGQYNLGLIRHSNENGDANYESVTC